MEEKFQNRLTQAPVGTVEETIRTNGVGSQIIVARRRGVDVFITTASAHMMTWKIN
jgi:hypothetical protein